ncbi:hypothetical protein CSUI_006108 [Cystoisospora suis]|uniref:Uncharacterized protein n=1 Tax=Cystoisospora suis TaxID=483139 RepID=A0A2C6KVK5_9APIC|nr:hypothetical protein CSUI_006108 [Cystoisospora suis]
MNPRVEPSPNRRKSRKGPVSVAPRDMGTDAEPGAIPGEEIPEKISHKENIARQVASISPSATLNKDDCSSTLTNGRTPRRSAKNDAEQHKTEFQQPKAKDSLSRKGIEKTTGKRGRKPTDREEVKKGPGGTDSEHESFPESNGEEVHIEQRRQPWRFSRANRYAALLEEAKRQKRDPKKHKGPSHNTSTYTGGFYDNDIWESSEDDEDWSPEKIFGKNESRRLLNSRYSESSSSNTEEQSGEEQGATEDGSEEESREGRAASDSETSGASSTVLEASAKKPKTSKNSVCSKAARQRKKPPGKVKEKR